MKTWVLLRGLTRESGHWGNFPTLLQAQLGDACVIAMDLPGNGALHAQASPLRVPDMAECCRTALRAQGIAPPYHLLAMSLGGMVAVDWASRFGGLRPDQHQPARHQPAALANAARQLALAAAPDGAVATTLAL